jgi:hypothetical protein
MSRLIWSGTIASCIFWAAGIGPDCTSDHVRPRTRRRSYPRQCTQLGRRTRPSNQALSIAPLDCPCSDSHWTCLFKVQSSRTGRAPAVSDAGTRESLRRHSDDTDWLLSRFATAPGGCDLLHLADRVLLHGWRRVGRSGQLSSCPTMVNHLSPRS